MSTENKPLSLQEAKEQIEKQVGYPTNTVSREFMVYYANKFAELYMQSHTEALRKEIEKQKHTLDLQAKIIKNYNPLELKSLREFKSYVHDRLDKMGIPSNPEPEENAKHGCRIEGRLNFIERRNHQRVD